MERLGLAGWLDHHTELADARLSRLADPHSRNSS